MIIKIESSLEIVTCVCGVSFAIPSPLMNELRADHSKPFYCPNGHRLVMIGETLQEKVDRLQNKLDSVITDRNRAWAEHHKAVNALKRLRLKTKRKDNKP